MALTREQKRDHRAKMYEFAAVTIRGFEDCDSVIVGDDSTILPDEVVSFRQKVVNQIADSLLRRSKELEGES